MISLIYGSTAALNMSADELLDILSVAKSKNDTLGITGMLLYKGGNFLQVLEGDAENVEKLYEKIKKDPRHYAVETIFKRKIKQREFANWQMGFLNLDEFEAERVTGYTGYLSSSLELEQFRDKPSHAYTFIKNFKHLIT